MSMNLHAIVRDAITRVHDDQPFSILRSLPTTVVNGVRVSQYEKIDGFAGNFQSEGDAALSYSNNAAQNTIVRRLYLYATDDRANRPWTIYRPLARSGDYIVNAKSEYWKVEAVVEDFSDDGWELLRVTFQQTEPKLAIVETTPETTEEEPNE
jgi:hypothetical protein